MSLTYVDGGLELLQEDMVNKSSAGDYTMILYTARTSSPTSLSDITEATAAGYSAETMTGSGWITTTANPSVADYPKIDFTFTAAENVLGYALKKDSYLIGYEDFSDGPYNVPSGGGTISVTFSQSLGN
jgi:hypothetical protein